MKKVLLIGLLLFLSVPSAFAIDIELDILSNDTTWQVFGATNFSLAIEYKDSENRKTEVVDPISLGKLDMGKKKDVSSFSVALPQISIPIDSSVQDGVLILTLKRHMGLGTSIGTVIEIPLTNEGGRTEIPFVIGSDRQEGDFDRKHYSKLTGAVKLPSM